jgi:hypothetical protein
MKRMCAGWWAALVLMLAAPAGAPQAQTQPPTEPIPRIETGMHNTTIWRIGIDASCRLMVTGSEDKTARLWALPEQGAGPPKLLRVLRVPIGPGDDGKIFAAALSPDGRFVAAGGWNSGDGRDDWVYVFDAATGKLIRRLGKLDNVILHLTWSADGRYLAATLAVGEGLRVWETTGWSLVGDDRAYGGKDSYDAAFDATDRLYTVAFDGLLRRYGAHFKLEGKRATLGSKEPFGVAVHPNGDRIAVGFNDSTAVEVYSAKDLQRLFPADTADVDNGDLSAVAWSADGARLYAGGRYYARHAYAVRIWDQEGRGKGRDVALARNTIQYLLPCGDKIAVATQDPAFGLISLHGEKLAWQESAIADMRGKLGSNFTVSDDGSKVRFGLGVDNESPVLFDLAANRLTDQPQPAAGLGEPDTTSLKLSDWEDKFTPKLDGKPLALDERERARSVAIAPGGDRFVLGRRRLGREHSARRQVGRRSLWRRHHSLAPAFRRRGSPGAVRECQDPRMGAVDAAGLLHLLGRRRPRYRLAAQQGLGPSRRVRQRGAVEEALLSAPMSSSAPSILPTPVQRCARRGFPASSSPISPITRRPNSASPIRATRAAPTGTRSR